MSDEIKVQLDAVIEAMHTCAILRDMKSQYELSLEILRLGKLVPLRPDKVQKVREEFGLTSAVWILAELNVNKE